MRLDDSLATNPKQLYMHTYKQRNKIICDFEFEIVRSARRSDLDIINQISAVLGVSQDHKMKLKECEKLDKVNI